MAQDLVTKIRLDDKQFKSIIDKVKSEVGNTETVFKSSSGNIKQELKAIQGELSQMLLNGVDPASEKFQQLAARAGSIMDAMGDARGVISGFANDTRGLSAALDVAGTGIGIFQTVAGSLALFGVESEDAKETLTKLAGAMSVLNGITQLQNTFMNQASGTYRAYHALLRLVGIEQANNTTAISANTLSQTANSSAITANTTAAVANNTVRQAGVAVTGEQTAAQTANSTATVGATTATEGLTIAQRAGSVAAKGLKVALSSIGIGLLITAVSSLISHWEDIVGWFKKTFPQLNNLGSSFNKLKVVIMGVGNSVLQYIITPFKAAASVINDLLHGNFEGLVENAGKILRDGYNFSKNYQVGANRELLNQQQAAQEKSRKSQLEALDKEHARYVAKHGQNLKSEVEYHHNRLKLLKKGTDEYENELNASYTAERQLREQNTKEALKKADEIKRAREKAIKEAEAAAKKAEQERKRTAEKIAGDQASVKQTIETDHITNEKNTRKNSEEQITSAYNSDKVNNTIKSQGALENQLKLIDDYYTKLEQFRQADLQDEIDAINRKSAALVEKAHGNSELLKDIEKERQAAIQVAQEKYLNNYNKNLDQRAKDEQEAGNKLLQPLLDKARQLGQELGRNLKLDGLDFSALEKLNKNLEESVANLRELKAVQDNLSKFQASGITGMIEDAKALQQILGSKMANDSEKIGASMVFMSSALQQLGQDSAAAKAGLVLQAIGQIILGFAQATAQDSKLGVLGWVAAISAGTAVMLSTISQLQSFSQGGIFKGSKTVGDHNLARVNAGEMILTNTQQSNLFRLLDNNTAGLGGNGVGVSSVRVKGSDLYLALSNYSKVQSKTGKKIL